MALPAFDGHGLLPPGCHACTWSDLRLGLGFNSHRRALLRDLFRFVRVELKPRGLNYPIYIDGSFCRNKLRPQDVDIVLDVSDAPMPHKADAFFLRFEAERLKRDYRVDFWFLEPKIMKNDLTAFFSYLGTRAASDLGLSSKWPKGILRIDRP